MFAIPRAAWIRHLAVVTVATLTLPALAGGSFKGVSGGRLSSLVELLLVSPTSDDSVWINQEIQNAIAQNRTSYTLPAGTYDLQNPIVIPPGTSNFSLYGGGSSRTVLRSSTGLDHAIVVGDFEVPYFQYKDYSYFSVPDIPSGVRSVRLASVNGLTPGYYVLNDDYAIRHKYSGEYSRTRAELVRVLYVNTGTRTVVFDVSTGREYTENARLSALRTAATENIRVQGMSFDGNGDNGATSDGGLRARHVSGLTLVDFAVRNYAGHAIQIETCRNVVSSACGVYDATAIGPGQGYGVDLSSCRYVTVSDLMARNTRHAVQLDHGTSDVLIQRVVATSTLGWNGGIDMHGQDNRRITVRNCYAPNVNIAHEEWLGGASDISVEGGRIDFLLVGPNTVGLRVLNPNSKWIRFTQWDRQGNPLPASSKIDHVTVQGGLFSYGGVHIDGNNFDVTSLSFVNTTFITMSPDRASVKLDSANGSLSFISCRFQTGSTETPIQVSTGTNSAKRLMLTMEKCRVISTQGLQYGAILTSPFRGRISFRDNIMTSTRSGARFLNNAASAPGVVSGS